MAGGVLGAWEGSLVLAAYSHHLGMWERLLCLLIPSSLYGLLFWIGGLTLEAVLGRWLSHNGRRRALLNGAWVVGTGLLAAWVFRYRLRTGLSNHLAMAIPAVACTFLLAGCGWWAYRKGRFLWLSFGLPVASTAALSAFLLLMPEAGGGDLEAREPVGPTPEGKPNVVLITWDTVRADTLPMFGGSGLELPELERLAADGFVLEDFQAVAPVTGPAHASIVTGLFPPSHGLRSNGDRLLDGGSLTLAEHFEAAGYATGGFVSGLPLTSRFGFDDGFQVFDDRAFEGSINRAFRSLFFASSIAARLVPRHLQPPVFTVDGDVSLGRALRWLKGTNRPYFLWLHLYDAHAPHRPPEPYLSRVLARAEEGPRPLDPSREEGWVLQRGEIEFLDHLVGRLLDGVRELDPELEQTAVVLAADHGECFGEGGFYGHHASIYQATQHIVGLVRPQGSMAGIQRGGSSGIPTSQVDLFPTICELAGLEQPPVQGLSLMPLLRGEGEFPQRGLYLEAYTRQMFDDRLRAWRDRPWTYGVDLTGKEILIHDERGVVEIEDADPELLERLREAQRSFLSSIRILESETVDDPVVERGLRDLGYVGLEDLEEGG